MASLGPNGSRQGGGHPDWGKDMRRCGWLLAGSAAAALAAGLAPAFAAEPSGAGAEAAGQAAPGGATQIGDVIVTARKVSESAQRVPVALTVLSGQNLVARSISRLSDLSSVAPNLFITNSN